MQGEGRCWCAHLYIPAQISCQGSGLFWLMCLLIQAGRLKLSLIAKYCNMEGDSNFLWQPDICWEGIPLFWGAPKLHYRCLEPIVGFKQASSFSRKSYLICTSCSLTSCLIPCRITLLTWNN